MKYCLLYIFLFLVAPLTGQQDTIKIKEIIITGRQLPSDLPGFKKSNIDTILQNNYKHLSLSELLSECSSLYIKSYGYGGTATTSFRGTGASHTQVFWNGININSPMLGQSDFSLFAPGMNDFIDLSYGGASSFTGPGGFGGSVSLGNKPAWSGPSGLYLSPGIGSFGHYSGFMKLSAGTGNFRTVTRLFLNDSENNFPYMNNVNGDEPLRELRKNSQLTQRSFLEELYFRKAYGIISAMIWLQSTSRNLPGSMLVIQDGPDEKQFDQSLRSIISYEFEKGNIKFNLKGAWSATELIYVSKTASINSVNNVNTFTLRGDFETKATRNTTVKLHLIEEYSIIETNNYTDDKSGNNTSLAISAHYKRGNRFGSSILLREILDGTSLLFPDFSAGIEYRIFSGIDHFLKSSFSRNSRLPSMNDRYWNPGGNSSLKNEYALQYEIGYRIEQQVFNILSADAEFTFYTSRIRDMIQWQPGKYSYWTAQNIGTVNASGFESVVTLKYNYNKLNIGLNTGYSYTRSVNARVEQNRDAYQLMYIPENQANSTVSFSYGKVYLFWITDFTGKRYITVDNSEYLPGYILNNIRSGIKIDPGKTGADINFTIQNLFNTDYQTIAFHPQPGRSYFLTLSFKLIK